MSNYLIIEGQSIRGKNNRYKQVRVRVGGEEEPDTLWTEEVSIPYSVHHGRGKRLGGTGELSG